VVSDRIETVRRIVEEAFNRGIVDVASQCAPDFVNTVCVYGVPMGPAGLTEHVELVRRAYPDLEIVVTDAIADASSVVIRWDSYGTAVGTYMGFDGSGRAFKSAQIAFFAFRGDAVVEWTGNFDSLSVFRAVVKGEVVEGDRREPDPSVWTRSIDAEKHPNTESTATVARDLVQRWLAGEGPTSSLPGVVASTRLDVAGMAVASGPGAFEDRRQQLRGSFGDYTCGIEQLVACGDTVALRWSLDGQHVGPFLGIRPTGRRVRLASSAIARLSGSELIDWREIFDDEGFLEQTRTRYVLERG
jgi:predicted ester cyclase